MHRISLFSFVNPFQKHNLSSFYSILFQLAEKGLNVILISRSLPKLEVLAKEIGENFNYFPDSNKFSLSLFSSSYVV